MKRINELREQRNTLAKEIRNLLEKNPGKEWKPEHQARYDAALAEIEICDGEIGRLQAAADLDAETNFDASVEEAVSRAMNVKGKKKDPLFAKFLTHGLEGFTNEEMQAYRNTMSTTTPAEGGYTVASLVAQQLYDSMKACGTMRAVAEIIPTSDGKPLSYPTSDGTAETGEWIAQNTTATGADPTFGTVSLNVFKASSKIVAVPFELLQDSVIDIEAFVFRRLGQRLGRLGNTGFTVGAGSTQPDGIVPRSSSGKVGTTGQTLTIIYDDIVDLVHAVDPAYRSAAASFMASDSLVKVIRKLKDTAGRPIWMPSYDQGISRGANPAGHGGFSAQDKATVFDYLLGYPLWINNDMAVPAANAKTMVFGDLSYYKIRDAMQVSMFRFTDSAYTKLGQVGFLAWARMGGNLMDTAAVKYYQHSAS